MIADAAHIDDHPVRARSESIRPLSLPIMDGVSGAMMARSGKYVR